MNKEEIIKISVILKRELPLTTTILTHYGFTKERIEELVKDQILEPLSYETYQLSSAKKLYDQGIELLQKRDFAISDRYFEVCYQIEPQNRDVCLQLLLRSLKKRKYQEVYEMFSHILQITPSSYDEYNNIYLYLISYLPSCPKNYLDIAKHLHYENMVFSDNSNEKNKSKINTISETICENKYVLSAHLINDVIGEEPTYQVKYQLLKELLSQVIDIEKAYKVKLTNLAEEEAYFTIIASLEDREQERNLTEQEENMILLSKIILNILETRVIPTPTIDKTDSLSEAILRNNFSLAMQINNNFRNHLRRPEENNPLNILLIKINELIDVLKNEVLEEQIEHTKVPEVINPKQNDYDFAVTSELFIELRKDGHIPTKKELAETIRVIDITVDHELKDTEDMAYYLKESKIPFDVAVKKYGIIGEEVLLIKLIYARDYYLDGKIELGDKLLHEVENSFHMTNKVAKLVNEVKENRNKPATKNHTRKKKRKNK